jgi:membrane fusion protein (multidrug efflux system)
VEARQPFVVKLPRSISTVGSLRSDEAVIVRPEIAGRVAEIAFQEGQRVARGQVLIRLDDSVQRADLERARANLTLSRSKFDRAVDLRAKGFISSQAKDEAENTFKVAQADAELAAARLAKTEIRASFGGIIGLRSVSVGDYVKEGQDIVNLEEIDPLKVDFRVPEVFLSQLKGGQVLQITMDALPDRTWPGKVFAINPLVDANGRAIAIRAMVPNADGRLRPGMFARVRLLTSEERESLMIPEESIFPVGDDKYVYKVVDGRAMRQKVEIGQRREGKVEILGGLTAADPVVTAGVVKLRDGAPVRVANAPASPPPVGKADAVPPPKGNS